MECTLNKSFSTRVDRTPRVIDIAEAFGIGLEDKKWHVLKDLVLNVEPGDVVYICGQSGSGKSVLLRELQKILSAKFKVADIDQVEFGDGPLIDQIEPDSMSEAIKLLSYAGISDAYLYVRPPHQLSDGQKYRFRLAKLIESDADVWIADEFGAVLDRITAKVVAYNMQKMARSLNKILIVATTHTDLKEELGPSLTVVKRFQDRVTVEEG